MIIVLDWKEAESIHVQDLRPHPAEFVFFLTPILNYLLIAKQLPLGDLILCKAKPSSKAKTSKASILNTFELFQGLLVLARRVNRLKFSE